MSPQPRRIAAAYTALIFLAGAAVGVAGHRFYAANVAQAESPPQTATQWRQQYTEKLRTELDLSAEQVARVQATLEEMGARWCALWQTMEPEFNALRQESDSRISGLLQPEQKARYHGIVAERDERHRQRSEKHCK